jgi:glycosyltransferase involved in cell wall biosynthesis
MRVAYICADFGVPVFGTKGASIHVRELTRALSGLGHEVVILTPRADGARVQGFDVPVHELRPPHGTGDRELQVRRYGAHLRRRGLEFLRAFAPEVVYERYSLFGTGGFHVARALDVPLLLEVNAPLAAEQARYRRLDDAGSALHVERALLLSADHVLAVSRGVERWLHGLGVDRERVTVVPNGVDHHRFRPNGRARTDVREALGLDGMVVGFVGTLKPWHDVLTLVRALALFGASERPQLLVVGDGPERGRLAAAAEDAGIRATFTGAVAHESVPAYLSALDVAVVPYAADENFYFSPLKLVEYLAAARPVVAADIGDIGHCVRPGETGWLYEPGDESALAAAIRSVLADPVNAAAVAAAGRAHVCSEHTWEQAALAVVELAGSAQGVRA